MKRTRIGMAAVVCVAALFIGAMQQAQAKKIIFIYGTANASDTNLQNCLNSTGITVGATTIPGLGHTVTAVTHGTEQDTYTAADADLIYISQSVTSTLVKSHMDDPVALVDSEQTLSTTSGTAKPCYMFFGAAEGTLATPPEMKITNNTHDITKIFPLGILAFSTNTGGGHWWITGPASGVTVLAEDAATPGSAVLGVMETGTPASGFYKNGVDTANSLPAGATPTPARRAILGIQNNNNFNPPTVNGVYLFQRTIQWALGDAVTAGGGSSVKDWNNR